MRIYLNATGLRTMLLLTVFFLGMASGIATVSFSGDFYNSDYSTSISESGENVNVAGFAIVMPAEKVDEYPYSILAGSSMCANQAEAETKFSSIISASGNGKSFSTSAMLQEDPEIAPVLCSRWSYSVALGDAATLNGQEINKLDQTMEISSIPGFGTYPSSSYLHPSVTTGIVSNAFDENGRQLFPTEYIPPSSFTYPLTLGVYYTPGAHFKNVLEMHVEW